MCGIVGIVSQQEVAQTIYDALLVLQHRGQDSAGIVVCDQNKKLNLRKDNGQVSDVFHTRHMLKLTGTMGIGHVRYPTAGCSSSAEAQPFYVNSPYGISLAHNGNLTNMEQLKAELYQSDLRHINTESDSEVLLNVFAHELQRCGSLKLTSEEIFTAVTETHKRIEGAYAVVLMLTGKGILGFRDPHGIRPVVYGKRDSSSGTEYMSAPIMPSSGHASSNMFTSRARTRSSTISTCTRRACAWASNWPARYCDSSRSTTSTW